MDGQVRFQAKMTYGRDALMALQLVAGKTTRRKYVGLRRGFDFVISGLMLIDAAIMLWTGDYGLLTWLMIVLGLVFLGFGAFYYQLSAFRAAKAMSKEEAGLERLVSFTDVRALCIAGRMETKFEYPAFKSLYRWKDFLILFVDDRHALLVDQTGLTLGAAPELQAFLEEKTGKTIVEL